MPGLIRFGRHFWPYLREYRKQITVSMLFLFAETALIMLEPWPLKFIIDRITGHDGVSTQVSLSWLDSLDSITLLSVAATMLVIITLIRAAANYYSTIGFALVGNSVLTRIRSDLFRHLQTLSLLFHDRARTGDLVVRVIGDVGMMKEVVVTALLPLFGNLLIFFGIFIVMLWLDWQLSLIVLATMPLLAIVTMRRSRRIQHVSKRNRRREGDMAATASESIVAMKTVQSLSLDERFSSDFSHHNNKSMKEGVQVKRLATGLERGVDVMVAIATALVLWFGSLRVMSHALSPGELLVFIYYLKRAFRPMRNFAKYTARLAKASAAGERVLELFDETPEIRDSEHAIKAPDLDGDIEFRNVSFSYDADHSILNGIDLHIPAGQYVHIVGSSGNGKSTLASLLPRLYDPGNGAIFIDGRDIREYTLASLRSQISVVLQDTLLFASSIRENIALGAVDVTDEEIEAAARLANAHEFISLLPDGYDTIVGERGSTLSNGQRQRIAIARAAVRQTPILILDEPTVGLDPENEILVSDALERLASGRTTLHITHRLDSLSSDDYIICIQNGEIVEKGTKADLLARGGFFSQLGGQPFHQNLEQSGAA